MPERTPVPAPGPKTMPPAPKGDRGLSPGLRVPQNRMIRDKAPLSAGVLRDLQTLHALTVTHGHLLLLG